MKKNKGLIVALIACVFASLYSGCKRQDIVKPQNLTRARNLIDEAWRAKPNVRVFSAVPENADEFARIRGRRPNLLDRWDVSEAKKQFDSLELAARGVVVSQDRTKQGFINFVASTEEELIIVIGHNDRGKFYFVDGKSLPLKEMASLITQKGKKYCFLSCVARKHVAGPAAETSITPLEAVAVVRDVNQLLEQRSQRLFQQLLKAHPLLPDQSGLGLRQIQVQQVGQDSLLYIEAQNIQEAALQRQINKSIKEARRQQKIKYIVVGGSPGSMLVIKMIDNETSFSNKLPLWSTQKYKHLIQR